MADVFIGLVHYPVYNRRREEIASALTTIDMHDLARLAATYGLAGFFVVTPVEDQLRLAEEMIRHWRSGWGAKYNQDRAEAFEKVKLVRSVEEAEEEIESGTGQKPALVGTSAAKDRERTRFSEIRPKLADMPPLFLLFGTAWGLTEAVLERCDIILEAVNGPTEYNHLSVRSAAGIILDRLFGQR